MKYPDFKNLSIPEDGNVINYSDGKIAVSDKPIIPFIQGDGIGKDVWPAAKLVIDEAVKKAYKGEKKIVWLKLLAGEEAYQQTGEYLPADTMKALEYFKVSIKGPLTTPIGGGIRSLNVTIRQKLDLYACVRPVRYFEGIPSVVKNPEDVDVVIFRENTEDLYKGIEYQAGSAEVKKLIDFLNSEFKASINYDSGIGIKPISESASKRIIRRALNYAIENNKKSVTLVHKGNIMKFTEGAFRNWGYELIEQEYKDSVITLKDLKEKYNGQLPEGKVLVKDVITDAMFQEMLLRPEEYDVIVTMNLNGDYLSDACAAQVGGLGLAPGANMSDSVAVFEATHGTAPNIAGQDLANPSSLILSAVMMLEHLGWQEAVDLIVNALEAVIKAKAVTSDIEIKDARVLKCSEFARMLVDIMN